MERCKKKQSASNQTSAEREGSEELELLIGAEPNELGIKLQQAHTLWDTVDQLQRTLLCLTLDSWQADTEFVYGEMTDIFILIHRVYSSVKR